ncbi:hypothetical protein BH11PLA2_BH11PLA2_42670 [soil metagenome]
MWTPRRILLLLVALFGVGVVYVGYSKFLGRFDGLPGLPTKFLDKDDKALPEPPPVVSPTIARLREAFGDNCPEIGSAYPTRLEIREQGIVFAAGMPQIGTEPTRFVRISPLSVATFGKSKPLNERLPGEVNEISTLHSDEGILEFDKPIASDRDMLTGKAKLIGIEFRSNPDPHVTDARNGRIHMGNNQHSADPGRAFVMKTTGPLFYRTADHPDSLNPALPNVWTMAAVEIVNRDNLPRPLHGHSLPAVPINDEALAGDLVAQMALGLHTPPPTVTANGMKLFMNRTAEPTPGKVAVKKPGGSGGYSGIREMILLENVLFSLWTDGGGGFPGSDAKPEKEKDTKLVTEPDIAVTALLGGLVDGKTAADRLKNKSLLRVRTLGAFHYDMPKNRARFEVAAQANANPLIPNNVEVTRHLPIGAKDVLVCQLLDIEFFGPVTGTTPSPVQPKAAGPAFKKLTATGSYVLIAAATDQVQAQGTSLIYENDPVNRRTVTTLHGAPLSAVRGKSVLIAGASTTPAMLTMTSIDPKPGTKEEKVSLTEIAGPGQFDSYDEATGEPSMTATWTKSMNQSREVISNMPLDRLTFTGDGQFKEAKGTFRLKADVLKLWLKVADKTAVAGKPTPHMLHGLGNVDGHSDEAIIEKTDFLTVLFQDVPRPVVAVATPPTVGAAQQPPTLLEPVAAAPVAKTKAIPMKLSARKVDVLLHRLAPLPKAADSVYELSEARCDDRVSVFQESSDPKKYAVGLDIKAGVLLMKKRGTGHEMTVLGTPQDFAKVRFENTTISGNAVVIDQPNNRVNVDGPGWLRMPSSSGLSGAVVNEKSEMTIHWQTRMKFLGERRWAEFVGQVQAVQAPTQEVVSAVSYTTSSVACHEMNVTFDRPVYFNSLKKKDAKPGEGDPRVERVVCTPPPADGDGVVKPATNTVLLREETFDRITKKAIKAQQIEAKLLEVFMNEKENMNVIDATGPGTTRILQLGEKENKQPAPMGVAQPGSPLLVANQKPAEQEMKLTVVRFNGRLALKDKKGIFQTAVFRDTVRVAQVPSDNLNLIIDEFGTPPPRSMFLKCNDTLTVSSYKAKVPGAEESRTMEAEGAAEVKTDEYIGMGNTISYDGLQVILKAYGDGQATLYRRQRTNEAQDYKSGNPLIYNTKTGQISGAQSSGGQFTAPKK